MNERKLQGWRRSVIVALFIVSSVLGGGLLAESSDVVNVTSANVAVAGRISDLYVFESSADPTKVVLAMTVNCGAQPGQPPALDDSLLYRFEVDADGDLKADHRFLVRSRSGKVRIKGYNLDLQGDLGATLTTTDGSAQAWVGSVDDPFFGELKALPQVLKKTGTFSGVDDVAGTNCTAIVLEMPRDWLAGGTSQRQLKIWASVVR